MSVSAPVPENAPVMVAWKAYLDSAEYPNTERWAVVLEHTKGSLWAAFYAGFYACAVNGAEALASSEAANARMREALKQIADGRMVWESASANRRMTEGERVLLDGIGNIIGHAPAALSPPVEGGLAYGDPARSGGDHDGISAECDQKGHEFAYETEMLVGSDLPMTCIHCGVDEVRR